MESSSAPSPSRPRPTPSTIAQFIKPITDLEEIEIVEVARADVKFCQI
jgi:hypothetical protein